jgi:hypothetical protein
LRCDFLGLDFKAKISNPRAFGTEPEVWDIFNWNFGFVSDFEFRISDFQGCGHEFPTETIGP